jgi:hypothetical protein
MTLKKGNKRNIEIIDTIICFLSFDGMNKREIVKENGMK